MTAQAQIFLSYTQPDEEQAKNLYQKLSDAGFKPWMASENILPGEKRESSILRAIRHSHFVLILLSVRSVQQRGLIQKEIKTALDVLAEKLETDIYLIPVRLEACEVPDSLKELQCLDIFEQNGWTKLVKTIQSGMERLGEEIKPPQASSQQNPTQIGTPLQPDETTNQQSTTHIKNLNNQGVMITGGRVNISVDQRKIPKSSSEQEISEQQVDERPPVVNSRRGKLVVISIGEGNFETGFSVSLQIGDEGTFSSAGTAGRLPAAPEVLSHYKNWQSIYRNLYRSIDLPSSRLQAPNAQITNFSNAEFCVKCRESGDTFKKSFNTWLNSELFRPCKETFFKKLNPDDNIRVLIQTEDAELRRLPWYLWDLLDESYRKAEIALSILAYDIPDKNLSRSQIRILAILGNSEGINIQEDRKILENLREKGADCVFLVEPSRREVDDRLWDEQGWDILFFAGHSWTQSNAETGKIYINKNDSLLIGDLRYALSQAIDGGLQLAIFNSCDGLGIARELAALHIPQIIVMREPVPDLVAQEFLKNFLTAFSRGESLYLAVRKARERLYGLEDKFPCATWLPVICQNPAEVPPTWQEVGGKKN